MYTTIGSSNLTRTADSHLKGIISTNCCIHTVVPPDNGHRLRPKHVAVDEIY